MFYTVRVIFKSILQMKKKTYLKLFHTAEPKMGTTTDPAK